MRRFRTRLSVALGASLVSLVVFTAAANAAVGDIFEHSVPTSGKGGLNRITHGPDGNIWFTNPGANQIGRMTPAGRFAGFPIPTPDSSPIDITTGPDGALWFTEYAGSIGRITTSGTITEFKVPSTNLYGITRGPGGALWFVANCCDATKPGAIGRITTSGAVTLFPVKAGTTPTVGITAGPDGNLWYPVNTGSTTESRIQRMSPAGVVTGDFPIPTAHSDPSRIVTGPDGNLWFTEQGAVGAMGCCQPTFPALGKIGRITPSGKITEFTTPGQSGLASASNPAGIAVGPDGNLWFTEYSYFTKDTMVQHGGNKIGRITTSGRITEFPAPTPYARADGITGGPAGDNHLYFTESPANFVYGTIGSVETPIKAVAPRGLTAKVTEKRGSKKRGSKNTTLRTAGRLLLPSGIAAGACTGRVSVQIKHGTKLVSRRTVALKPNCAYSATASVSTSRLAGRRPNRVIARFEGNKRLTATRVVKTVA